MQKISRWKYTCNGCKFHNSFYMYNGFKYLNIKAIFTKLFTGRQTKIYLQISNVWLVKKCNKLKIPEHLQIRWLVLLQIFC